MSTDPDEGVYMIMVQQDSKIRPRCFLGGLLMNQWKAGFSGILTLGNLVFKLYVDQEVH